MDKFKRGTLLADVSPKDAIADIAERCGLTRKEAKVQYNRLKADEVWINDLYQVNIDRNLEVQAFPGVVVIHLSIKRRDKARPARDWRHLQQIKNELVGPEYEAVELYPAQSRVVDVANQTHLWCFTAAEGGGPVTFPLGWTEA